MSAGLLVAALVLGAASYRAWRVVAMDTITEPLRARLLARDGRVAGWVADLLLCPWCLGWWINVVAAGLAGWHYSWHPLETLAVLLAASTVTGLIGHADD